MYKFLTPSQEKWQHNSLVKNCILEQICQQWTWERHMLILQKKGKGGGLILAVRFIEWWIHKSCDSSWRQTRGLEINKEDWKTLHCVYILKQTKPTQKVFQSECTITVPWDLTDYFKQISFWHGHEVKFSTLTNLLGVEVHPHFRGEKNPPKLQSSY